MQRKKILFLVESLNVGGAEKALVSLLKLMDYTHCDITLTLISKSGTFLSELEWMPQLKINSIVTPSSSLLKRLYNAIKVKVIYKWLPSRLVGNHLCKGYDVVIAFCEGYLTKWVATTSIPCKKIAWVHTDMVNNDWPVRTGVFKSVQEERKAYGKFDHVVAVSDIVAKGMIDQFGTERISTIYNIIDSDIIRKAQQPEKHFRHHKFNLVSVGRLEYVKGFDQLIDALAVLVNKRDYDISLTLVGDGSQSLALREQVASYNLQDYVTFVGSVSNPYPYMADADVFVCPSRQEGFNIAILEAMTLGKPVIATRSAGPSDILEDGKYGLLAVNSVKGIADAISEIYRDQHLTEQYSQLAISRSHYYNAESQLAKLYSLMNS